MGFFDKLFAKKICDLCGGEIGLLGNKKLEDGNCCKNCAKQLSPWFDDRRHSTVEQIKAQLLYREKNKSELESFSPNVVLGDYYKMYIEIKNGIPTRFVASAATDYKAENADIVYFKNVCSCDLKIRDSRTEQKYTNDKNERVSYNPPRYEYHYDFYIRLGIANTLWFDDMDLRINRSTLKLESASGGNGIFIKAFDPMLYPEYRQLKTTCDEICNYVSCGQSASSCTPNAAPQGDDTEFMDRLAEAESDKIRIQMLRAQAAKTADPAKKEEYLSMASFYSKEAPSEASLAPQEKPAAPSSTTPWQCPSCSNENTGKFCSACGTPKPTPAADSASGWKCFCGTVNNAKFCENCATCRFSPEDIECSECSWTAESWHEEVGVPSHCPNCGKEFNSDDIK